MNTTRSMYVDELKRIYLGIYWCFILKLDWEPSSSKVTKSYSCRLPALGRFYGETKYFDAKVDQLNLESQNQAKNISVGLPSSPIKI